MKREPVAVFLIGCDGDQASFEGWRRVKRHRYCQALMRASHGESVLLRRDEVACPAAAAAFGFSPLPERLESGHGLVGFGIVERPETGRSMFEGMTRLESGAICAVALSPLKMAPALPDVVVVEGATERLMWLLLAEVNRSGGARLVGESAVLQATCVDATIIPFVRGRLNFSFGCYGCREATDLDVGESVIGFPGALTDDLCDSLEFLGSQAIGRSRAKRPFEAIMRKEAQNG